MFQTLISGFCGFRYKFVLYLIVFITNVQFTIEHDHFYKDNHHAENRMSLETCLGRFDVHVNTIIRTGESQAIGGKFLQGLELETPEKCQRLCCETTDCDVYVFEEKNDGYCYLFQCGSPKNFHCKFTRHANYTSALLTQSKAVLTTTQKPKTYIPLTNISTQEQELISLKAKPEKFLTSSSTPPQAQQFDNLLLSAQIENRNLSCGRFEFPCHSGECIAVYNACNGIPQCLDGSDEGPECLDPTNNKNNNDYLEHIKSENVKDSSIYSHGFKKFEKNSLDDNPVLDNRHSSILKGVKNVQTGSTDELGLVQKVVDFERLNDKLIPNRGEIYEQMPEVKSSFPTPQIADEKAHIFNENSKWPTQQRPQFHVVAHEPPYSGLNHPQTSFEKNAKNLNENTEKETDDNLRNIKESFPTGQRQSDKDIIQKSSEQNDHLDKNDGNGKKLKKPEVTQSQSTIKNSPHPAFVEQYKAMEQHLEFKFVDHDGHSEKPRGAVLSFTLGLMITAVIVIMVACRLRTVGRRGSRHSGKTPYAPDEDFLVNGMYL